VLQKFLNNFEAAKQQALEMGTKAGEMALDVAASIHTKATRLALVLNIKVSEHSS